MSQLSPPFYTVYKNLFSLKFETGSYLNIIEKILYTFR